MARPAKEEKQEGPSPKELLGSILKANPDDHYNFAKPVHYKVSTGSILFDAKTGGGLAPGLHRFVGYQGSGKTSETLEICRNFIATVPKPRGVYVKAEGRLSKELSDRTGLKFVTDYEQWEEGTVFVLETNIFETMVEVFRSLVKQNTEENHYCFIIDSTDSFIFKEMENAAPGETKNSGYYMAKLYKEFFKKFHLAMAKGGHLALMIGQITADIVIDHSSKNIQKAGNFAGGNALMHWPDFIFDFKSRIASDLILDDPNGRINDGKSKALGHNVRLTIRKSSNESTFEEVEYPVKHGKRGGSIWVEREVGIWLIESELVKKKGAWISFDPKFKEELTLAKIEVPDQIQGEANFYELLENNQTLVTHCITKYKNIYSPVE
jgi:hypothetical protein